MPTGPGDILDLIRHGRASTRGDVLEATGLSRMTVAQRLDALLDAEMIIEGDTTEANGPSFEMIPTSTRASLWGRAKSL